MLNLHASKFFNRIAFLSLIAFFNFGISNHCEADSGPYKDAKAEELYWNYIRVVQDDIDSAFYFLDQLILRATTVGEFRALSDGYNLKGSCLTQEGRTLESLLYYQKAIMVARKIKNKEKIRDILASMGTSYMILNDFANSEKVFLQARELTPSSDTLAYIKLLFKEAELLIRKGDFGDKNAQKEAINKLLLANKLNSGLNPPNLTTYSITYPLLATVYERTGQCSQVKNLRFLTIKTCEETGDNSGIMKGYMEIASYYNYCEPNGDKMLFYMKKADSLSASTGFQLNLKDRYLQLCQAYQLKGDYKKAFEYSDTLNYITDSLAQIELTTSLREVEAKYQFSEQQRDISQLKKIKAQQAKIIASDQRQKWYNYAGILAGIILSTSLFIAYRNREKYTKFIAAEAERKELLLEEVNHRINNSLQITTALLSMQEKRASSEEVKSALQNSQNRVQSMVVMHNLLKEDSAQNNVNIKNYLNGILEFHRGVASTDQRISIEANIPDESFSSKAALPLGLIVNEVLTNSYKYAFPEGRSGRIELNLLVDPENEKNWLLSIGDNGVGVDENKAPEGTGLGRKIIHILTNQLRGKASMETDKGLRYKISFPV